MTPGRAEEAQPPHPSLASETQRSGQEGSRPALALGAIPVAASSKNRGSEPGERGSPQWLRSKAFGSLCWPRGAWHLPRHSTLHAGSMPQDSPQTHLPPSHCPSGDVPKMGCHPQDKRSEVTEQSTPRCLQGCGANEANHTGRPTDFKVCRFRCIKSAKSGTLRCHSRSHKDKSDVRGVKVP